MPNKTKLYFRKLKEGKTQTYLFHNCNIKNDQKG